MSVPNEQTQTVTKSRNIIDIGKQVGIDLEVQADTLLDEARSLSDNRYGCLIFCGAVTQKKRDSACKKLPGLRTAKSSPELSSFNTNWRDFGWLSGLSGHQYMHPFQIIGHGHQLPFARGRLQAS